MFAPSLIVVDGTCNSTGGDIQLGTATAYELNDFRQIYGKCTISGAATDADASPPLASNLPTCISATSTRKGWAKCSKHAVETHCPD